MQALAAHSLDCSLIPVVYSCILGLLVVTKLARKFWAFRRNSCKPFLEHVTRLYFWWIVRNRHTHLADSFYKFIYGWKILCTPSHGMSIALAISHTKNRLFPINRLGLQLMVCPPRRNDLTKHHLLDDDLHTSDELMKENWCMFTCTSLVYYIIFLSLFIPFSNAFLSYYDLLLLFEYVSNLSVLSTPPTSSSPEAFSSLYPVVRDIPSCYLDDC